MLLRLYSGDRTEPMDLPTHLQDDLVCSVCLERLRDPRTLLCGHSFCHGCLTRLMSACSYTGRRCPDCRAQFAAIPQRNVLLQNLLARSAGDASLSRGGAPSPPPMPTTQAAAQTRDLRPIDLTGYNDDNDDYPTDMDTGLLCDGCLAVLAGFTETDGSLRMAAVVHIGRLCVDCRVTVRDVMSSAPPPRSVAVVHSPHWPRVPAGGSASATTTTTTTTTNVHITAPVPVPATTSTFAGAVVVAAEVAPHRDNPAVDRRRKRLRLRRYDASAADEEASQTVAPTDAPTRVEHAPYPRKRARTTSNAGVAASRRRADILPDTDDDDGYDNTDEEPSVVPTERGGGGDAAADTGLRWTGTRSGRKPGRFATILSVSYGSDSDSERGSGGDGGDAAADTVLRLTGTRSGRRPGRFATILPVSYGGASDSERDSDLDAEPAASAEASSGSDPDSGKDASFTVSRQRRSVRPAARRTRCGKCVGCQRSNCGSCGACKARLMAMEMGVPNKVRQACRMRSCTLLKNRSPHTAK